LFILSQTYIGLTGGIANAKHIKTDNKNSTDHKYLWQRIKIWWKIPQKAKLMHFIYIFFTYILNFSYNHYKHVKAALQNTKQGFKNNEVYKKSVSLDTAHQFLNTINNI